MTETLKNRIRRHEGFRSTPYRDSEGNWTVGYGHLMSNPLPKEALEITFTDDFAKAIKGYYTLPREIRDGLTPARREVLVEMIFQLGVRGVLNFKLMCKALIAKDHEKAAEEIMDSDAGRKHRKRFKEHADMMRHG